MEYKQKSKRDWYSGAARTEAYRATITDKNDPEYLRMKADVAERNNCRKRNLISTIERYYIDRPDDMLEMLEKSFNYHGLERTKLCGRGRRRDAAGNRLYPNVDSHLRHADSKAFDVYIHRNWDAEEAFIKFCKKEFAPSLYEQDQIKAEISKLEYKLLALKQGWKA